MIAENKAVIAEKDKSIAEKDQRILIIKTTDSIRIQILPLMESYLTASTENRKIIRDRIIELTKQLKKAEIFTQGIEPISETNRQEKE